MLSWVNHSEWSEELQSCAVSHYATSCLVDGLVAWTSLVGMATAMVKFESMRVFGAVQRQECVCLGEGYNPQGALQQGCWLLKYCTSQFLALTCNYSILQFSLRQPSHQDIWCRVHLQNSGRPLIRKIFKFQAPLQVIHMPNSITPQNIYSCIIYIPRIICYYILKAVIWKYTYNCSKIYVDNCRTVIRIIPKN